MFSFEHLVVLYLTITWLDLLIFSYLVFFMTSLYLANRKQLNWWFTFNSALVGIVALTILLDFVIEDFSLITMAIRSIFYFYSMVIFIYNMIRLVKFDFEVSKGKEKLGREFGEKSKKIENLIGDLSTQITDLIDINAKQREIFNNRQKDLETLKNDITQKKEDLEDTDVYQKLDDFFKKHGMKKTTVQTIFNYSMTFLISFTAGLAVQYVFEIINVLDPETLNEIRKLIKEITEQLEKTQ